MTSAGTADHVGRDACIARNSSEIARHGQIHPIISNELVGLDQMMDLL